MSLRHHKKKSRPISGLKREHIRKGECLHPHRPPPRQSAQPPAPDDPADHGPITAHALVRYMERVHGLDVEQVCAHLLADGREAMIKTLRNGRIRIDQHCTLVVRDGHVVTILAP